MSAIEAELLLRARAALQFARDATLRKATADDVYRVAVAALRAVPPWPSRKEAAAAIDAALAEGDPPSPATAPRSTPSHPIGDSRWLDGN